MQMTPFQTFVRYLAIKNHFTLKSYDAFKYQFKVRTNHQSFEKRKDKSFFYVLSKHKDIDGFLVSLFIRNPELWVGDIVHGMSEADEIYRAWKGRTQALKYTFQQDIKKLDLSTCFKTKQNNHPDVLKMVLREEIAIEVLAILNDLIKCGIKWEPKLKDDIIYQKYSLILNRYISFLTYDKKEFKLLLIDEIENQKKDSKM
jgi:hypothetical protein